MNIVDLHVHSTKSDGTYTPTQLVDYAIEKGLSAFALTDHDSVDGLKEAITYANSKQPPIPEVIPGIELSTEYEGSEVHIVGLYIDYENPDFINQLQEFVDSRTARNIKMCKNLQEAGIPLTYEQLEKDFPDCVITRAHFAKWMLQNGYIKSMSEAFERYVGDHCPCYVPREKITPVQGVTFIRQHGGIPIFAHPILCHFSKSKLERLTLSLKEAGLLGIEAIYSTYKPADEREIRKLANACGLAISGGSDFHGDNKPGLDLATGYGKLFIPEEVLDNLKKALHSQA